MKPDEAGEPRTENPKNLERKLAEREPPTRTAGRCPAYSWQLKEEAIHGHEWSMHKSVWPGH